MKTKIAIAVPLESEHVDAFITRLNAHPLIYSADVTLIHLFKMENLPYVFPPMTFPDNQQQSEISKSFDVILENFQAKLEHCSSINHKIIFTHSPKESMVEYIKENQVNVAVTMTRPKEKIADYFHSSFTSYLVSHAPCDVITLRSPSS